MLGRGGRSSSSGGRGRQEGEGYKTGGKENFDAKHDIGETKCKEINKQETKRIEIDYSFWRFVDTNKKYKMNINMSSKFSNIAPNLVREQMGGDEPFC